MNFEDRLVVAIGVINKYLLEHDLSDDAIWLSLDRLIGQ